jgi:hypothetical protein
MRGPRGTSAHNNFMLHKLRSSNGSNRDLSFSIERVCKKNNDSNNWGNTNFGKLF